jgi:hypothetical protein
LNISKKLPSRGSNLANSMTLSKEIICQSDDDLMTAGSVTAALIGAGLPDVNTDQALRKMK